MAIFPNEFNAVIIKRTRALVRRSQLILAASRIAVPARWLSPVDREPEDLVGEPLPQPQNEPNGG